jgi:D-alanyl-D-alanine carboxypeptidase
MVGRLAFLGCLGAVFVSATAETPLPEGDDYESFEVEPPILMPNRATDAQESAVDGKRTNRDPDQLEKQVERAKRSAAEAEKLFKSGILSRVEVEVRALRVVRLQGDLEAARVEHAEAEFAVQKTRSEMGEIPKEQLAAAQRDLDAAIQREKTAAAERERAEIAAAERNLRRQQKLAKLGSARPSDVAKAEQRLSDVKAARN